MYLGDYRAMAQTHFKKGPQQPYIIFVDTRDVSIAPHLLAYGLWEHWVTDAIAPFLGGSLFVDVGANFGWYTVFAHYAEARKIVSVEPNPRLCTLLRQSLAVNGIPADVFEVAASDCSESLRLTVDMQRVSDGMLFEDNRQNAGWGGLLKVKNEIVEVESKPLDELLTPLFQEDRSLSDGPIVLKIDVEGFEPRVILGAKDMLSNKNCTAFVENHHDKDGTRKLREMLDFFEQTQYNMGHVSHDGSLKPLQRSDLEALRAGEMLCFQRFPA